MFKTTGVHNQNHLVLVVDPCCFKVCSKQQGSTTKIILFWVWTPVVLVAPLDKGLQHAANEYFMCGVYFVLKSVIPYDSSLVGECHIARSKVLCHI